MCQTPEEYMSKLYERAEDCQFIENIDVRFYSRIICSMYNMAIQDTNSNDLPKAYILFVRTVLLIKKLSTHKDYATMEKSSLITLKNLCSVALDAAEKLYPQIKNKYTAVYLNYVNSKSSTNSTPVNQNFQSDSSPTVNDSSTYTSSIPNSLSKVYLSRKLIDDFLVLSNGNTRDNRETCATLCGVFRDGRFMITNLLIPKQTGTSESCVTYNEEEVFSYLDSRQLLALGWIHTHPTQTAFLSAVDLHCQLSYQAMLPEAIAVVCAPKFNDVKCYSLTLDHGISFLSKCKKSGFHPHVTDLPLYEESQHVTFDDNVVHVADDLRCSISKGHNY